MADEFRVSLVAELKQKSLDSAIRNAKSDVPLKINKFSINATSLAKQLQAELNKANLKVKIDGNFMKGGTTAKQIDEVTKSFQELMKLQKSIGSMNVKIAGLDAQKDAKQIAELNKQLDALKEKYKNLYSGNASKLSSSQTSALIKAQQDAQAKLDAAIAKSADKQAQAAESAAKRAEKAQTQAAKQAEKEWKQAAAAMKKDWEKANKEALTSIKSEKLSNDIQAWMGKNTKAADAFRSELENILSELSGNKDPAVLQRISTEFAKLQSQAKAAGLVTNSFLTNFKNIGLQVLGLGSAFQIVTKIIDVVKEGVNTVVGLDTALVDLRKTTTMSDKDLVAFYRDANTEAKKLGATTQQIIQSAADWSRLGFSSKTDATMMARYSAQFAAISPGLSVDDATTGLVSVMKAYGLKTDEVLDGIMSKINRIGNTAATSNAEIIQGLQNAASAMAAMNTNLDKTIALFTAGQEIAQDASKVGNALRSISLRVRGYDEETEELSENLTNITGDVIDLTKVASNNYKGVSLFTDETQTQYKDIYDYLHDIAEIWDELDAKTKQNLMEKLFGKNRANIGLAIIQNFEAAEKAMSEMSNSAGDADREMSIIMDSLEYKLNELKETGVGIWQNLFPREGVGSAIEVLTALLSVLESITGFLGPGGTLLAAGGLTAFFANFGRPLEGSLNSEIFKLAYHGQGHAVMVA